MKSFLRCVLAGGFLAIPLSAGVTAYRFPAELRTSDRYQVVIDQVNMPAIRTNRGAIASFGMDGEVRVGIRLKTKPGEVVVRPLSAGIRPQVEGTMISFVLPRPMNLSVEIDGDLESPLFLFANAPARPPDRNDPSVRYFEAGRIHEAGEIFLRNGETMYVEGGAVVRGLVRARNVRDVVIRGEGILDATTRTRKTNMVVLRECRNARIENLILLDPLGWTMHLSGSENVTVANTRVIGWRANSDGLDIEYSSHVVVDGCFWRTNDDCIAIKAIYPPGTGGVPFEEMINPETLGGHKVLRVPGSTMEDIAIKNCVLWNDEGGQGFEIGFELRVDSIRDVSFRNSDIIHVRGGGAFTIHNGDRADIEGIVVEDVRVEDAERLVDFQVGVSIYSEDCPLPYRRSNPSRVAVPEQHRPPFANNPYQWYVPAAGKLPDFAAQRGSIRDVTFRRVDVLLRPARDGFLIGYSAERPLREIRFEGLRIAGRPALSTRDAGVALLHTEDVEFR